MPITITSPPSGGPLGPGFLVSLTTNAVGPWPTSTFWDVQIYPTATPEYAVARGRQHSQSNTSVVVVGQDDGVPALVNAMVAGGEHGKPATLVVRHMQDDTTVLEQTSIPVVIDMQSGVPFRQQATAQSGGFTGSDRILLTAIGSAWIWELAGEVLPELAEFLAGRVRTSPVRRLYDPDRAGIGELLKPETGFFIKWVGIEWELIEIPPGVGFDEGNPVTEEIDYMQLSRLRAVQATVDLVEETFYERRRAAIWYWGLQEPSRINYYILPGALVRFYALLQLEPVARSAPALPNAH